MPVCVRNRPPRYPGVPPNAGLPLRGTRTRSRTPPKRAFWGSNYINTPSFFLGNLFFLRTTTTDRPVAPWPHHKPEFSNFRSASPKWHPHAEPQRHEFWSGGSIELWPSAFSPSACPEKVAKNRFVLPDCGEVTSIRVGLSDTSTDKYGILVMAY